MEILSSYILNFEVWMFFLNDSFGPNFTNSVIDISGRSSRSCVLIYYKCSSSITIKFMTLPNDLSSITQAQIEQLVADQTREGPHLDFKRDLPTAWNDASKHEFFADTTAFANSGGGDLIFGIDEDGQAC